LGWDSYTGSSFIFYSKNRHFNDKKQKFKLIIKLLFFIYRRPANVALLFKSMLIGFWGKLLQ